MRGALLGWIILFVVGLIIGERYGAPSLVTGVTDRGFEAVEERVGFLPSPDAENGDAAGADSE